MKKPFLFALGLFILFFAVQCVYIGKFELKATRAESSGGIKNEMRQVPVTFEPGPWFTGGVATVGLAILLYAITIPNSGTGK